MQLLARKIWGIRNTFIIFTMTHMYVIHERNKLGLWLKITGCTHKGQHCSSQTSTNSNFLHAPAFLCARWMSPQSQRNRPHAQQWRGAHKCFPAVMWTGLKAANQHVKQDSWQNRGRSLLYIDFYQDILLSSISWCHPSFSWAPVICSLYSVKWNRTCTANYNIVYVVLFIY